MPGLFCGFWGSPAARGALEREFSAVWPGAEVRRAGDAVLGGHAFAGIEAIRTIHKDKLLALDGEWSFYRDAAFAGELEDPKHWRNGVFEPQVASSGVVVLVDPERRVVHAAVDASGTFPLYYAIHEGGVLLSSLCRPLARSVGRSATISVRWSSFAMHTLWGPRRSSQRCVGCSRDRRSVTTWWTAFESMSAAGRGSAPRRCRRRMLPRKHGRASAGPWSEGLPPSGSALMMSGGWDSRTLLGRASASGLGLLCYSHGDTRSRELRIVRKLCRVADQPYQLEPIDERILDPALLTRGFERTETAIFPHWLRAGGLLADMGITCVTAGVYGEILGGHYGPSMLAGSRRKIAAVAAGLLGIERRGAREGERTAREYLRTPSFGHHWYLDRDFEASMERPREQLDEAVDEALDRLRSRGVETEVGLVEAYVSEHRGAQYINAQIRSCRASTDVAVPFAGEELFVYSTRLPLVAKIHNSINRRVLAQHAPSLLREPMAATLVPAGWPLLLQEASRFGRKLYEAGHLSLHHLSGERIPRPRLGWMNFDFIRNSQELQALADDLRSDIWDREAIQKQIKALPQEDAARVHPVFDQFAKVYTTDLLLR